MPFGQSCPGLSAESAGEIEQQRVLGKCAPRTRRHQERQSLGEDNARTPSVATKETVNLDVQHDASAAPRKISQRALIAAVHAARTTRAERTLGRAARCGQDQS